jgi:N-acyl homoserine lactone hydrolase
MGTTDYKIYPLYIARLFLDIGTFHYLNFSGEKKWFPIYIWVIEGGGRKIVVDVACDAEEMKKASALGAPYENITTIEEALRKFDLSPETVETLVITHLHADHALNLRKFLNAKIYIQEEELNFARNPHPIYANLFPKGRFDGIHFTTIRGDYPFIDGIDILSTPGHSAGTQSVAVSTAKGRAIICGACSLPESFTPLDRTQQVIAPGIHLDLLKGYDSLLRIKKEADIILPLHDPSLMNGVVIG